MVFRNVGAESVSRLEGPPAERLIIIMGATGYAGGRLVPSFT